MTERFEWVPRDPTIYETLEFAALALSHLMSKPSSAAVRLTEYPFGRFSRVEIAATGNGWRIQFTDNHSFIQFLRERDPIGTAVDLNEPT